MSQPQTTAELREAFLVFFAEKGCERYVSAPLVPENDPTTLFTVAGMAQFKDMFLGRGGHPFTRSTTCQKCMRTNDILEVGRTPRHHTFFEMLGNFSFNDYFKEETIAWAWEFLTDVLKLDPARLSISVHDIDDEAYAIWRDQIGIPEERIFRMGDSDNFWPASAPTNGPLGPGGTCSEIFWDFQNNDDPEDNLTKDSGRFVEVWNLVFPQYNVVEPMVDGRYTLDDLGRRNIDTGMGLERLATVVQGKYNNFDNDLLSGIVSEAASIAEVTYDSASDDPQQQATNALLRRIADHVRAVTFAVADNAVPSNKGAGYIIRRLIRRATLDINKLGVTGDRDVRLWKLVGTVVQAMGDAYPEIRRRQGLTETSLRSEEAQFRQTLRRGLDLLGREMEKLNDGDVMNGAQAFRLYETFGFPREITEEILAERSITIDEDEWHKAQMRHKTVSTSMIRDVFTASALLDAKGRLGPTPFIGYDTLQAEGRIVLLEVAGVEVTSAAEGANVRWAMDQTVFYGESGGQVADTGTLTGTNTAGDTFTILVTDVQKEDGVFFHSGKVIAGKAQPGPVTMQVDEERRRDITRHHSATHLLQSALINVLGDHIEQQGSKVEPSQLRFDFNHKQGLSEAEVAEVERQVRGWIEADFPVKIEEMAIDAAKAAGAKALFGEKYGDVVRVVDMGGREVSIELCGGAHVPSTGDIGAFSIVREEASAAGVRRLSAVAGAVAEKHLAAASEVTEAIATTLAAPGLGGDVAELSKLLKVPGEDVAERVQSLLDEWRGVQADADPGTLAGDDLIARVQAMQEAIKAAKKAAAAAAATKALAQVDDLLSEQTEVAGQTAVIAAMDDVDAKTLRQVATTVQQKLGGDGVVVLGSAPAGNAVLIVLAGASAQAAGVHAGKLVGALAKQLGGGGGGRPDQAQAGGRNGSALPATIASAPKLIAEAVSTA